MHAIEPAGKSVSELVQRLKGLAGNKIIYYEGATAVHKSYPDVYQDVRQVQEKLRDWGVGAGSRVGIKGPNCYEWVVHELALLDLGSVTVTLPAIEFAHESAEALAERFELELLLAPPAAGDLPPFIAPLTLQAPPAAPKLRPRPEPLAPGVFTIVFSSGTTGALKAIQINREATDDVIAEFRHHYDFQPDDRILVALPLSTFQQRTMLYCAIWYGFDAVVVEPSPMMLVAMQQCRPTIMGGPPAFYEMLESRFRGQPAFKRLTARAVAALAAMLPSGARRAVQHRMFRQAHAAYGGRMRLMLSGSAPLRKATSDVFAMMGLPLFQLYGLTESGFIAWNRPGAHRVGSVGKPVFPGSVTIAGDGEILVRWPRPQSAGYLGEPPEVQQATFLADDTVATGDLGRFDDDGYLYVVGRKKDIIVTRAGYKIAPSPIEQKILTDPDIAQAVLVGGGDLDYVGAVIALRGHAGDVTTRVRRHIQEINEGLPPASHIMRVTFTREQFTRDNGLMTTTLKLNRAAVARRFGGALDRGETWAQ